MNWIGDSQLNAAVMSADEPADHRGTVLIVTSDQNLTVVAARVLPREGFAVVTAPHAGHALLAALTMNRIDVLLTELMLDDMAGEVLAATLRRYHPYLRALFMGQQAMPRQDCVLVRPFTRDELLLELNVAHAPAISSAF